jgi:hypothetical protein
VLLAATTWWAPSARLAIALMNHGCVVSAICPPGHPLRYVKGVTRIFPYRGLTSRHSLQAAIVRARPELVVPCDDRCVLQLHELHALHPELRALIENSLGDPGGFGVLRSRARFQRVAQELGVRVPRTYTVTSERDATDSYARLGPAAVLKLDGTSGGEGVRIVRSSADAAAAFRRLRAAFSAATAWKRLLVNRDPLALWSWRRRARCIMSMQEFIDGTPANIMIACWRGEILGEVGVQALHCQGLTGAANVVQLIDNHELSRAAVLVAKRLGMSGFFGLDFVLERVSGSAYLIEINPRCTQLGHLQVAAGDLAGALCKQLATGSRVAPGPAMSSDTIAFFPQAWLWGTDSDLLRCVHHDVPWEQQGLIEALMREPWPERQLPARLYHLFRRRPPAGTLSKRQMSWT